MHQIMKVNIKQTMNFFVESVSSWFWIYWKETCKEFVKNPQHGNNCLHKSEI